MEINKLSYETLQKSYLKVKTIFTRRTGYALTNLKTSRQVARIFSAAKMIPFIGAGLCPGPIRNERFIILTGFR
jgi:hypothetical protein